MVLRECIQGMRVYRYTESIWREYIQVQPGVRESFLEEMSAGKLQIWRGVNWKGRAFQAKDTACATHAQSCKNSVCLKIGCKGQNRWWGEGGLCPLSIVWLKDELLSFPALLQVFHRQVSIGNLQVVCAIISISPMDLIMRETVRKGTPQRYLKSDWV